MMKRFLLLLTVTGTIVSYAQNAEVLINAKEVERIERMLASDEMKGRQAGTAGSINAANYIASEFRKAGLQPIAGNSYLQEFVMLKPRLLKMKGEIDDKEIDPGEIIPVSIAKEIVIDEKSGYAIEYIKKDENIRARVQQILATHKNTVVFIDNSFSKIFPRLAGFNREIFKDEKTEGSNVLFVLSSVKPKEFKIKLEQVIDEVKLANVIGILPGKTKKEQQVIFSAHYDHLGIAKQAVNGDSIYNGANDDAAGTTAVLMLANYFKQINNNERTLVFAAFTAEESGGFGSQYFSKQFDPKQVVAMFNIEMIGTESKWGKNSAYLTGYEKTDMGKILQENLKGTSFTFYPDPYPEQDLFYRSDNATLAKLGVPAHTISTSKMDTEKFYHTVDDEIETLDLQNMAAIIKAIAESSKSIVAGKDTPSRVDTKDLH